MAPVLMPLNTRIASLGSAPDRHGRIVRRLGLKSYSHDMESRGQPRLLTPL